MDYETVPNWIDAYEVVDTGLSKQLKLAEIGGRGIALLGLIWCINSGFGAFYIHVGGQNNVGEIGGTRNINNDKLSKLSINSEDLWTLFGLEENMKVENNYGFGTASYFNESKGIMRLTYNTKNGVPILNGYEVLLRQ